MFFDFIGASLYSAAPTYPQCFQNFKCKNQYGGTTYKLYTKVMVTRDGVFFFFLF